MPGQAPTRTHQRWIRAPHRTREMRGLRGRRGGDLDRWFRRAGRRVSRCTRDKMKRRSGAGRPMVTPEPELQDCRPAAQGNRRRCKRSCRLMAPLGGPRLEQAGRASGQGSRSTRGLRGGLAAVLDSVCLQVWRCPVSVVCRVCVVRWFVQVGVPGRGARTVGWEKEARGDLVIDTHLERGE